MKITTQIRTPRGMHEIQFEGSASELEFLARNVLLLVKVAEVASGDHEKA